MTATTDLTGIEIAIVGMSGRFPGAENVEAFWNNIRDGVESIAVYSEQQLRDAGVSSSDLEDPDYVRAGVPFDNADQFDADFFGYTPREAENLDPQQRVFLECAWEALEHAGCDAQRWPGAVGVYAGEGPNIYLMKHLLPSFGLGAGTNIADLLRLMSGNASSSLPTRVAYKLNLRGPAVAVQTACSTSLTAVHLACQALLSHDCDMALAGGVWLNLLQQGGYRFESGAILSPDGHCRAFDADAAGTIIGSGAGVVVLKRLADAIENGDVIHAVIKGSAANNDGSDKIGFTAPSISGQASVIRAAQVIADVAADTLGYVEAHGTATELGDPIEVAALTQAFRMSTQKRGFCALGSVKTNIGHLDAAAGVAGLIKAAMALKNRTLPPSLHFKQPNPEIDFANSPFYVCTQATPWQVSDTPRRAAVSSFGIGGTNVHVILEEAPACVISPAQPESMWQVLPVSAKNAAALEQNCQRVGAYLRENTTQSLEAVADTLQIGRRAFSCRHAVVANSTAMAAQLLGSHRQASAASASEIAFLFPGGGAQHAFMGEVLYRHSEVFRKEVDYCCEFLQNQIGVDLRQYLFPAREQKDTADTALSRIELAQPALFIIEYAMARWWMHCGVRPSVMLGHSLGEYVAACIAGVFSLDDALRIISIRGHLMQTLAPGAMTAVPLSEAEIAPYLIEGCNIAAINAEQACVLSGTNASITRAEALLREHGHLPRRLHVSIASHSAMVEPIIAALMRAIESVPCNAPKIPFISNVTGKLITAEQAADPEYWAQHLRGTVRFADGLQTLFAEASRAVLEVGPGETLTALARQHKNARNATGIWSSQAHPQQYIRNEQQLANAIAGLWCAGIDLNWAAIYPQRQVHTLALPTYAFQRKRYWVDGVDAKAGTAGIRQPAGNAASSYFYLPSWQRSAWPLASSETSHGEGYTLLLGRFDSLTDQLLKTLRQQGETVVLAVAGQRYAQSGAQSYLVRPDETADLERLLRQVDTPLPLTRVIHLWSIDGDGGTRSSDATFANGFFSLLALTQALDASDVDQAVSILYVTNHMSDVSGNEPLLPEKATALGIAMTLGQEYPRLSCRVIDVELPAAETKAEAILAARLVTETRVQNQPFSVAYRGAHRWQWDYVALPQPMPTQQRLRRNGVYLITGGLGGVGLALARYLGREWNARLVLLGRTTLPARENWIELIADSAQPSALRRKLQQLMDLEAQDIEVLVVNADVTSTDQMRAMLAQVQGRFGAINGVVHAVVHPDRGMIAHRNREAVDAAFAPKLAGTRVLLDVLAQQPLDFVLLCSSVASLIGGLGRSDYAAANAYLDALAAAYRRASDLPVISVNWDAWRDVGIATDMNLPTGVGLDENTGVKAFERIVNGADMTQVIVSAAPFEQRLGALDDGALDALENAFQPLETGTLHPRPILQNEFVAPEGMLEESLATAWRDMLGIEPIGVHDNFFDLGGDSLLAIRLLTRTRRTYNIELHPADFFRNPTIAELAVEIELRLIDAIEHEGEQQALTDAV